jgi:hypothetical protein
MKKAGMPLTQECRITFTDVMPWRRLAYIHLADFIPGVEPYDVATVVELHEAPDGVRMVLTFDADARRRMDPTRDDGVGNRAGLSNQPDVWAVPEEGIAHLHGMRW